MKTCFKCGAEKPLSEYYAHPRMADGHVNKCKTCNKRDVIENRLTKLEYYREFDRNRENRQERNVRAGSRHNQMYATDPEFRLKVQETKNAWVARNPDKRAAQLDMAQAIRKGQLIRPTTCQHCGTSEKKIQGHHWSYLPEHSLDVIWLCTSCHGKEHKRLNELGRDPDKQ